MSVIPEEVTPKPISEDDKQLLVTYLSERVRLGVSGRDGEDLVDIDPLRAIFAGVLQPPRQSEIQASQRGVAGVSAPSSAAIGLDFRIKPTDGQKIVRLRLTPRWSHYYAVFPTWEQARRANQLEEDTPQPTPSGQQAKPEAEGQQPDDALIDAEELAGAGTADDDTETVEENSVIQPGLVTLPRVFRRYDVVSETISVEVALDRAEKLEVGREEIAASLQQARAAMASDSDVWHHLDEPEKRVRSLGEISVLKNREAYERRLQEIKREPVALPPWTITLRLDSAPDPSDPELLRVQVLLSNATPERDDSVPDPKLEDRSVFDAGLAIEVEDGELLPFEFLLAPKDYRSKPRLPARGINCTAFWSPSSQHRLETETLPTYRQPLYRTRESLEVRFEQLDAEDPTGVLEALASEMEAYLQTWDGFLTNEAPSKFSPEELEACASDRREFAGEVERYRLGIETLRRDRNLREAFRLMNRTFFLLAKSSNGKVRAWRLFQLGFIVSQLPSLAVRELPAGEDDEYAQALRGALGEVGILWFPTGGGKTEAYLGLISAALLYDRLRGKSRGLCAWMRFPMRMLSLQQMERLARVIAALNLLRAEVPRLQQGDPFAIGYFVGDSVTPNSMSEADMKRMENNADFREKARVLRKCPFCGGRLEVEARKAEWRLAHVCVNESCFSNTSEHLGPYKGSIPLCIVDHEIYRYLPSVLVGTIDKLAIVGREKLFAHLVRGVNQQCPRHGYCSYDECVERGSWSAACQLKKKEIIRLAPVKDPGPSLLIQDEFHLLKAELGVFNGHYEGLLRYLGEKAYLPPKVLAATATIEAYDVHAFHVYLSRAVRYPKPSWEQGESFYATSKPARSRRLYVGLLNHTRSVEESALRVLGLYVREVRRLKADPRLAAQVMNRPEASDDQVFDTLRLYDLSLAYVTRKATGGRLVDKLKQVERRALEVEALGELRGRLLTSDQTMEDIGAALDLIEREREETGEPRLDVVAATNLISHGVDLERINMMLMCGMPSHYAEYVQATSRAARSHPGVVFVCFNAREPREASQYEFFTAMHENLERLIEAVAVNRYASFAPRKTVPGLLAGVLLCDLTPDLFAQKRITKPLDYVPTLQVALGLKPGAPGTQGCIEEQYLTQAIERIIGVDGPHPPASPAQIENVRRKVEEELSDALGDIGRALETRLKEVLHPITSFRDVDEGIDFGSIDSAGFVTRLLSR